MNRFGPRAPTAPFTGDIAQDIQENIQNEAEEGILEVLILPCAIAENGSFGMLCLDVQAYLITEKGNRLCQFSFFIPLNHLWAQSRWNPYTPKPSSLVSNGSNHVAFFVAPPGDPIGLVVKRQLISSNPVPLYEFVDDHPLWAPG